MVLFKVTTVTLFTIFFMVKQSKGQLIVMHPSEDDKVLDEGATLNLTCTITLFNPGIEFIQEQSGRSNISWKLPDNVVKNKFVRNISYSM